MSLHLNIFEFENLQEAWEHLNVHLCVNNTRIKNGGVQGTIVSSYENVIYAKNCQIDPKFDFGRVLGYTDKKWSKLVNNYVNPNYLDLVASEIQKREKSSKNPTYTYTFHFDNKYGSGKDCLISITFTRKRGGSTPILTFNTRASEVTKRLIFDFLLIQRIAEYVYGKNQPCEVVCHIGFMFINLDCFLMYCSWKGLKKTLIKQNGELDKFQQKVKTRYMYFKNTPLEKITFKVSQRAAAQVQKDKNGYPVAGCKTLYAKTLKLFSNHKMRTTDIEKLDSTLTN